MRYIYLIITGVFFLCACSSFDGTNTSNYVGMAEKIMDRFAKDMWKKHYLKLRSCGGAFFEQINEIILSFSTVGPKSQEELRVLMVDITEDFLQRINSDEKIRQYLVNYPFKASNLNFRISLVDTKEKAIKNKGSKKEILYTVSLLEGRMLYSIINDDKACLQGIYREPYDEAREIVKKSRPDLFKEEKQ